MSSRLKKINEGPFVVVGFPPQPPDFTGLTEEQQAALKALGAVESMPVSKS